MRGGRKSRRGNRRMRGGFWPFDDSTTSTPSTPQSNTPTETKTSSLWSSLFGKKEHAEQPQPTQPPQNGGSLSHRKKTFKSKSKSDVDFTKRDRLDLINYINTEYADNPHKKTAIREVKKMHYDADYQSPFFGKIDNPEDIVYTQGLHRIDAFFKYGDDINPQA